MNVYDCDTALEVPFQSYAQSSVSVQSCDFSQPYTFCSKQRIQQSSVHHTGCWPRSRRQAL